MAGLVGGVVLPLLGAVPDGAIMFFSGLGPIEDAQETLSVGVGALAGSTIMLLTIPMAMSIFAGRVDLSADGIPNYMGKPKLSNKGLTLKDLEQTGVSLTEAVSHGAVSMMITTIPYFIIQGPAFFLHGPSEEIAEGEKWWALAGLIVCLVGFVSYLALQLQISRKGEDKGKRVAVVRKLLQKGRVSLKGALAAQVQSKQEEMARRSGTEYQTLQGGGDLYPPPEVADYLKEVLRESFRMYDVDHNGHLDKKEVQTFFRDFHEDIADSDMDELFAKFDTDKSGTISFDEFIGACYLFIMAPETTKKEKQTPDADSSAGAEIVTSIFSEDEEQEEEMPEELVDLDPDAQQAAIKKKAFAMLIVGTLLVVVFSDPMVDVMQQIAVEVNLSPFYVSFILAPLASNASEMIASQYYAAKKTRKTISVSITALEGAASMNNTFCLSIFMGLIFFRGLAWEYTAETIAIVAVEFFLGFLLQKNVMTSSRALLVFSVFPLSIALVATLEALGFD